MEKVDMWLADMDRAEQKWLNSLPRCARCGDPITDEYLWDIDGELYCPDCAADLFKREVDYAYYRD